MTSAAEHQSQLDRIDELLVVRPRPATAADTDIDITPMIDMVFLLLIFFLVTSRMSVQASVELPDARYGGAISSKQAVILTVAQSGDAVLIYKGDGIGQPLLLAATDPAEQEAEIVDYIRAELAAAPTKEHVLIKAGKDVKHKHVARVSRAVGRALGGGQLFVAVRESE